MTMHLQYEEPNGLSETLCGAKADWAHMTTHWLEVDCVDCLEKLAEFNMQEYNSLQRDAIRSIEQSEKRLETVLELRDRVMKLKFQHPQEN